MVPMSENIVTTSSSLNSVPVRTTQPDEILRHSISDEELDRLCEAKSDLVFEMLLIAVGTAIGSLTGALGAIAVYLDDPSQLSVSSLGEMLLCSMAVAITLVLVVVNRKRTDRSVSLRENIRSRTPPK